MKLVGNLILKYSNQVIDNKRDALIFVCIFGMLPFTTWLAVALMALITLRRGKEAGFNILLPAMVTHLASLVAIVPLENAIANVLITFIPAYILSLVLRTKANWSAVFGAILLQSCIGLLLLQLFIPDAVLAQYQHFQKLILESSIRDQWVIINMHLNSWDKLQLAHIFFGIQILIIALSTLIPLLLARFIQSKLFLPGGFKKEIYLFRSGKCALFFSLLLVIAAWFKYYSAFDILPLMCFYFFLSGLNLSFILLSKKTILTLVLCIISIMLNPLTMLMIWGVLGILDSAFNFRTYFFATAKKSI